MQIILKKNVELSAFFFISNQFSELEELGISRSVAIEMFYRQIILDKGIPIDVAIPNASRSREELTKEEFDKMMKVAIKQVEEGQTTPVEEVFEELYQGVE